MRHPLAAGRRGTFPFVLAVLLAAAAPASAITPQAVPNPRPRGSWVADTAGILSPQQVAQLNQVISALERDTGAEMAVVTITDSGSLTPKEFATDLLNRWGVGKRGQDNGVLVLLSVGQRRVEVETGYGIEPILTDGQVGAILDRYAVPSFRQGDYGTGLVQAVTQMAQTIRAGYAQEGGPPAAPAQPEAGSPAAQFSLWTLGALAAVVVSLLLMGRPGAGTVTRVGALLLALLGVILAGLPATMGGVVSWGMALGAVLVLALAFLHGAAPLLSGLSRGVRSAATWAARIGYVVAALVLGAAAAASGFVSLVLFVGVALAGWFVLSGTVRRLPRTCSRCGSPMRLLDETEEDAYLQQGQKLEEELGSVDYEVWHCDVCENTDVIPHLKPWSSYQTCPRCGYHTLGTERVTLQAPGYYQAGRERVMQRCRNCGFTRSYERQLPPRTPPPIIIGGGWGGGRGGRSGGGWGGFGGGGGWGGGGGFGGGGSGGGGAGRGW